MAPAIPVERFGVFRLAEMSCAIEGRYLRQVITLTSVLPVPRSAEHILGVVTQRGVTMVLCDLRPLLGLESSMVGYQQALIVNVGHHDIALAVDDVVDFMVPEGALEASQLSLSSGVLNSGDQQIHVLDVEAIVTALRQTFVAA